MTRNGLIKIEDEIERAVIALNTNPVVALEHARSAHRMLGEMLAPHEAGVGGLIVKDIEPPAWDHAQNLEYVRKLRAGEPTTEAEWDASYKWTRSLLSAHDPIATADATITALVGLGRAKQ